MIDRELVIVILLQLLQTEFFLNLVKIFDKQGTSTVEDRFIIRLVSDDLSDG